MTTQIFTSQEIERFRADTIGCSFVNHLNNAGAGLMPDIVSSAMQNHIRLEAETGGYEAAAIKKAAIDEFYKQAALLVNTRAENIAFTSSATDSFTRALSSIPFERDDVILTDRDDYISNQIQFLSFQKRFGVRIEHIRNSPTGGVDPDDLREKLFRLQPKLLAITHVPTNSGLVQPVEQIATIFREYKNQHDTATWYILDACQSIGQIKLDVQALECDFLSVTNRKFLRGPRGTGFLYIADRALDAGLEPLFIDMRGAEWTEGNQYKAQSGAIRFEDWEFAYALVLGSAEAIRYCRSIGEDRINAQIARHSDFLRSELAEIDRVKVLDRGPRLAGLVTFHIDGSEAKYIVDQLLHRRINVVGSFRNFAVFDFDEKGVQWAVRASPHYYNTQEELEHFLEAVKEIAALPKR
ncbi:MAG: aminotransferase class V-fold PLP-dependent enzyme [Chitinophagaceae bacterium]|nr:MAG: aminotransferase class V-fold PLP-dependent enzyme [Chitinophagaceae bacterium]